MTQSNAATTSNITIIPPRSDNLRAAMEELHLSQIDLGYRYSALALANALMSEVGAIFPQHMILIYLTTSYKRRQVWNAYLAVNRGSRRRDPVDDINQVIDGLLDDGPI